MCKFTFAAVDEAFNGEFMTEDKDGIWSVVDKADVPDRRPGSVSVLKFHCFIASSQEGSSNLVRHM